MKFIISCYFVLFSSLLLAEQNSFEYLYPSPNAQYVPAHASIILRLQNFAPEKITNLATCIRVWDQAREIKGTISIASDNKTAIFKPSHPFPANALIHVLIDAQMAVLQPQIPPFEYDFNVSKFEVPTESFGTDEQADADILSSLQKANTVMAKIMPNGVSVPSDFPHIEITTHKKTADGYIFLNHWREQTPYNVIFDNDGSPVWYARHADGDRRWDFKVQRNGLITMLKRPGGLKFLSYDENFNPVDEYSASGGYTTDEHEFIMLENGHYFLIGIRTVTVDMSQFVEGALTDVSVHENTIQEFTADHQLIFNWAALEHLSDGLPYCHDYHRKVIAFSFPHMNAIDIDDDGHILLSNRNLDEVTKINRQTGDIIWRLGGVHNQFTFVNDSLNGFNWQHDIRSLGDGYYSLFDNGREHHPSRSRAVVYKLDTVNMTATLVREYKNPPRTDISLFMGNVQKLPNDNLFINWAGNYRPKATEVTPNGEVVYEMNFIDDYVCYRTFRFPWHGVVASPYLIVESGYNFVTLIFNKFGDPNVDYYKIYAGIGPNPTTVLDTCRTTIKYFHQLENQQKYNFRVTAVSTDGHESAYSEEKTGFLIKKAPDENLIDNGDFSEGKQKWFFKVGDTAEAKWDAGSSEAHILIQETDGNLESIKLFQGKIFLAHGASYSLELDAWAAAPRPIEIQVVDTQKPDINILAAGATALDVRKKHLTFNFTVEQNNILKAELRFLLGSDDSDVYIDNIRFFQEGVTFANDKSGIESGAAPFELFENYPNPFNMSTTIQYRLDQQSAVHLAIYNLNGRLLRTLVDGEKAAGAHHITWDGRNDFGVSAPSGVYFYRLNGQGFSEKRKMLLVR